MSPEPERFRLLHVDDLEPVACPCGLARRAFASDPEAAAPVHVVEIAAEARAHFHKRLSEVYFVLEGTGEVELDGRLFPVRPGSVVQIRPGCRHRAVGRLKIVNVVVPRFDPDDEWFD
ncbi:MAG: cupin domain-containing protein [Planctomycetota bacterium]